MTAGAYRESAFQVRGNRAPLIGIRCAPAPNANAYALTVLLIPGQPQTRVGAHRMFVQLARDLARNGISSVRFDCSGWGDSLASPQSFDVSRFDVLTVAQAVLRDEPAQHLALLGFCDGASAACLALPLLRADHRTIDGVIMINPWIDRAPVGTRIQSSSYYWGRLKSRDFWTKLVTGRVQIGDAVGDAIHSVTENQQKAPDLTGLPGQMAAAIDECGIRVLTILAANDPVAQAFALWLNNLTRLSKYFRKEDRLLVADADHLFNTPAHWSQVCDWTTEKLVDLCHDLKV